MTFPPAGGPVKGYTYFEGQVGATEECPGTFEVTLVGNFGGGDGGAVNGTLTEKLTSIPECLTGELIFSGEWSGNFYANGTGSGIASHLAMQGISGESKENVPWQISYSPEEFASALGEAPAEPPAEIAEEEPAPDADPEGEAVTSETIFNNYGIIVEDSFGDDQYEKASWTEEELGWLNDVLKELPPELIKNMKIKSFIRNKVSIDKNGNEEPNVAGTYFLWGNKNDPAKSDGSEAVIRVYDRSLLATPNNPDPEKLFKGTILHEMIHGLQYNHTRNNPTDAYSTPLLYNYMDAVITPNASGRDAGWEYKQAPGAPPPPKWQLTSSQSPPTSYGKLNPKEDMCESVRIYMYDPQKLKDSSPQRYAFIRDEMFGGVEYENGEQKE